MKQDRGKHYTNKPVDDDETVSLEMFILSSIIKKAGPDWHNSIVLTSEASDSGLDALPATRDGSSDCCTQATKIPPCLRNPLAESSEFWNRVPVALQNEPWSNKNFLKSIIKYTNLAVNCCINFNRIHTVTGKMGEHFLVWEFWSDWKSQRILPQILERWRKIVKLIN